MEATYNRHWGWPRGWPRIDTFERFGQPIASFFIDYNGLDTEYECHIAVNIDTRILVHRQPALDLGTVIKSDSVPGLIFRIQGGPYIPHWVDRIQPWNSTHSVIWLKVPYIYRGMRIAVEYNPNVVETLITDVFGDLGWDPFSVTSTVTYYGNGTQAWYPDSIKGNVHGYWYLRADTRNEYATLKFNANLPRDYRGWEYIETVGQIVNESRGRHAIVFGDGLVSNYNFGNYSNTIALYYNNDHNYSQQAYATVQYSGGARSYWGGQSDIGNYETGINYRSKVRYDPILNRMTWHKISHTKGSILSQFAQDAWLGLGRSDYSTRYINVSGYSFSTAQFGVFMWSNSNNPRYTPAQAIIRIPPRSTQVVCPTLSLI